MRELLDQPLYDFVMVDTAEGSRNMFAAPIGIDGKTSADTNLVLANRLPRTNDFTIRSVGVSCPPQLSRGALELHIFNRLYLTLPFAACRIDVRETKRATPRGYRLSTALAIQGEMPFGVTIRWSKDSPRAKGRLGVLLYGDYQRNY